MTDFAIEKIATLPAGKYLVFGDLRALSAAVCPKASDAFLNDVFFSFNYDNQHIDVSTEKTKTQMYFGNTEYGEGVYHDSYGGSVSAKYGVICLMRVDEDFADEAKELAANGGYMFNADRDFKVTAAQGDGLFTFLDRSIETNI